MMVCCYEWVLNVWEGKVVDVSVGEVYGFFYVDLIGVVCS